MTIETKFNIGDEVWFIKKAKAIKGEVVNVYPSGLAIAISDKEVNHVWKNQAYKTKEELIESLFN